MRYLTWLVRLAYYILYRARYRRLDRKAAVYFSVRITGKRYISIGRLSMIQRHGWLLALKIDQNDPEIIIGNNCAVGDFSHIASVRSVRIEDNVLVANKVYISDNIHLYEDTAVPVIAQPVAFKGAVRIGEGSWIGENACIIGASVGRHSIVGANAVVTKDIPDYCVAVGSPAKVIKRYDFNLKQWIKCQ